MEIKEHKIVYKNPQEKALHLAYCTVKSMYDMPTNFTKSDTFIESMHKLKDSWQILVGFNFDNAPIVEVLYNAESKKTQVTVFKEVESYEVPD